MAWNLSIYLDRHVARDSISTSSAGPAKGLLARRPDLIIEAGGTFSAIEVASKAQRGNLVAARAEEGLEAALGYGEATGINSVGFTLPWSIGGVRTVGASSLPATYGIGAAGALDVACHPRGYCSVLTENRRRVDWDIWAIYRHHAGHDACARNASKPIQRRGYQPARAQRHERNAVYERRWWQLHQRRATDYGEQSGQRI